VKLAILDDKTSSRQTCSDMLERQRSIPAGHGASWLTGELLPKNRLINFSSEIFATGQFWHHLES
jgi:hypothetical protein